jgi:Rieske Fe-S protein
MPLVTPRPETHLGAERPPDAGRRRFLDWLLGGALAGLAASVLYPVLRYISPPLLPEATTNQVEVGPVNDPELVGKGFKIVRFGAEPVIVLRTAEGELRAFSATCTHLDCIVEFQRDRQRIFCNCHNGEYNLRGHNVGGPPPRPLAAFKVDRVASVAGEIVVVSRT